ncbi:MAG: dienelactone hydrolase family protein [Ignavibacteriae bacterium]|nr:dienelactone hydrolase family protein [Ignavibacteriota bacterium]
MNINPLYWLDLRKYKPNEIAKKLNKPMLILQGHRDYQVTYEDFKLWQKSLVNNKKVEMKSYPKLNHLFMEGEGLSTPNEYNKEGHVSELVIKAIAGWIHKQK